VKTSLGFRLLASIALAVVGTASGFSQTSASAPVGASSQRPAPRKFQGPSTYGTTAVSYIQVPQSAFLPYDSSRAYTTTNFGVNPGGATRYATGSATDFNAPLMNLPAGALIVFLELEYCDTDAGTNYVLGTFVVCDYLGNNCVKYPTSGTSAPGYLTSQDGSRGGCSTVGIDMSTFGITVNNFNNHYLLDIITNATDGTNSFAGMIVGYILQVSPAPAVATFLDVPTTHPQFQFIEALVASGITAGCGGGNYCPTANLTRGQMAVFLAKALGLQFN
jgi:S-layer family protein